MTEASHTSLVWTEMRILIAIVNRTYPLELSNSPPMNVRVKQLESGGRFGTRWAAYSGLEQTTRSPKEFEKIGKGGWYRSGSSLGYTIGDGFPLTCVHRFVL